MTTGHKLTALSAAARFMSANYTHRLLKLKFEKEKKKRTPDGLHSDRLSCVLRFPFACQIKSSIFSFVPLENVSIESFRTAASTVDLEVVKQSTTRFRSVAQRAPDILCLMMRRWCGGFLAAHRNADIAFGRTKR